MVWEEFKEQAAAYRLLKGAVVSGRVAHAYLFLGPDARGKEAATRWLAQALNCVGGRGEPCAACRSCHLIAAGTHPDVRGLAPRGRHIRLDEVRELVRTAAASPLTGQTKVYIINEADKLLPEAANHLLKLLEEPPPATVFVLTAARDYALLPTIVSRCQVVPFRALAPEVLVRRFIAEGHDPDLAHRAAFLSGGDADEAAQWLSAEGQRAVTEFLEFAPAIFSGKGAVLKIAAVYQSDPGRFLTLLSAWYRDLILWRSGRREGLVFRGEEELLERVATLCSPGALVRSCRAVAQALRLLSGRSTVNVRLVLEALLVELAQAEV